MPDQLRSLVLGKNDILLKYPSVLVAHGNPL